MWKHFTSTGAYNWVKVLPKLVDGYNKAIHTSIGMAPLDVNEFNRTQVWERLYGDTLTTAPILSPFSIGDHVRLLHPEAVFKKGYDRTWTEEVFKITDILQKEVPTYKISDLSGEPILGFFYKNELLKVRV
jgi:hypothetical protein